MTFENKLDIIGIFNFFAILASFVLFTIVNTPLGDEVLCRSIIDIFFLLFRDMIFSINPFNLINSFFSDILNFFADFI